VRQIAAPGQKGDDLETPDGHIQGSEYERKNYGLGYGLQLGEHSPASTASPASRTRARGRSDL